MSATSPDEIIVPFEERKRAYDTFNQLELALKKNRRASWICLAPYAYIRRARLAEALESINRLHVYSIAAKMSANGRRGLVIQYALGWRRGYITLWFHDIDLDEQHRAKSRSERLDELSRIAFLPHTQFPGLEWWVSEPDTRLAQRVRGLAAAFGYKHLAQHMSLERDRRTKVWWIVGGRERYTMIPDSLNASTFLEALEAGEAYMRAAQERRST